MSVAQLLNIFDRVLADSECCVIPCLCHFPLRAELLSLISASLIFVPSVLSVSFASGVWFQSPWTGWGFGDAAKRHPTDERCRPAHTHARGIWTHARHSRQARQALQVWPTVCFCLVDCWQCVWKWERCGGQSRNKAVCHQRTWVWHQNLIWFLNASSIFMSEMCLSHQKLHHRYDCLAVLQKFLWILNFKCLLLAVVIMN